MNRRNRTWQLCILISNGEYVNCRKGSGSSYGIKYYLPHGEKVSTTIVSGNWTKITPADYSSKGEAWVLTSYLSSTKPTTRHDEQLYALGNKTLQSGRFGRYVYNLQKGLRITADGMFGAATETAVRQFQTQYGLTSDGYAGDLTKEKVWIERQNEIISGGK